MELTKRDIEAIIHDRVARSVWKRQIVTLVVGLALAVVIMEVAPVDLEVVALIKKIGWAVLACCPLIFLMALLFVEMSARWKSEKTSVESDASIKAILAGK